MQTSFTAYLHFLCKLIYSNIVNTPISVAYSHMPQYHLVPLQYGAIGCI